MMEILSAGANRVRFKGSVDRRYIAATYEYILGRSLISNSCFDREIITSNLGT